MRPSMIRRGGDSRARPFTAIVPLALLGLLVSFSTATLVLGCSGPLVLLPGGALDGETRPVPDDWSFAGDAGTMQLESRPAEPYSVNIAYTFVDSVFYINAGDTETQWVKNIAANDHVKARLDGVLYEMRAVRVDDEAEIARFATAWTGQSFFRRDPTQLDRVWVYRLVAR